MIELTPGLFDLDAGVSQHAQGIGQGAAIAAG